MIWYRKEAVLKKELIQDFSLRISQASKTELIVIMYDIILEDIKAAKEALLEKNSEGYTHELKHAGRIVNELMSALDYTYPVSYQLMSLYIFLNKQLIDAGREQDGKMLDDAADILETLREGFSSISALDYSGPLMQNTQQVYAGLTYGRGTLNETCLDPSQRSRGFMA